jgi:hypothetical protein
MSEEEKKDFKVTDRRIFSQDSPDSDDSATDTTDEAAPGKAAQTSSDDREDRAAADQDQPTQPEDGEMPPLPEINFSTFVVSLNASALLHLGAIEDPTTGQTNKNLPMAKQTIDIFSMLEEKTAGNLNPEETNLLKSILYDLRMLYVKESG